jgi:hypothetical protein
MEIEAADGPLCARVRSMGTHRRASSKCGTSGGSPPSQRIDTTSRRRVCARSRATRPSRTLARPTVGCCEGPPPSSDLPRRGRRGVANASTSGAGLVVLTALRPVIAQQSVDGASTPWQRGGWAPQWQRRRPYYLDSLPVRWYRPTVVLRGGLSGGGAWQYRAEVVVGDRGPRSSSQQHGASSTLASFSLC